MNRQWKRPYLTISETRSPNQNKTVFQDAYFNSEDLVSIPKINCWLHHQRELYYWFVLVLFGFSFGLICFYESRINAVEYERSWPSPCSLDRVLRNKYVRSQTLLSSPTELPIPIKWKKEACLRGTYQGCFMQHCKVLGSILWRWLTHILYCGNGTDISEKNILYLESYR